jgi:hypothetical protein
VVLLSAEDDVEDTIRPRLDAAGAMVEHVTALQAIEFRVDDSGPAKQRCFNLESDVAALERTIEQSSNCRLVIIDPVSEYPRGVRSEPLGSPGPHLGCRGNVATKADSRAARRSRPCGPDRGNRH